MCWVPTAQRLRHTAWEQAFALAQGDAFQAKVGFGTPPHRPSWWSGRPWGRQVLPSGHPMRDKPWGWEAGVDHPALATTALQGWRLL